MCNAVFVSDGVQIGSACPKVRVMASICGHSTRRKSAVHVGRQLAVKHCVFFGPQSPKYRWGISHEDSYHVDPEADLRRMTEIAGAIEDRRNGVLISQDDGDAVAYALWKLDDRGRMFVSPGEALYEGMIIGIHTRDNDLVVNPVKEKKLTNVRASFLNPVGVL